MTELDLSDYTCPDCKGMGTTSAGGSWWTRACRRCGGSGWDNGRLVSALVVRINELKRFGEAPAEGSSR